MLSDVIGLDKGKNKMKSILRKILKRAMLGFQT